MPDMPITPPRTPTPTPARYNVMASTPQRRRARTVMRPAAPQPAPRGPSFVSAFNDCFIKTCTYLFGRDGRGK